MGRASAAAIEKIIFCEKAGENTMLTVTWLLYGADEGEAEAVRERASGWVDRVFGRRQ